MGDYLFLLLLLACPLMMVWMMRSGHGGHSGHGHSSSTSSTPVDDLRRQRCELDRMIEEREAEQA